MLSTTILIVIMLYILECWRDKNQPTRYTLPEKQPRLVPLKW